MLKRGVGRVELAVLSAIAIVGVFALVLLFTRSGSTGRFMQDQTIFVQEDNPCATMVRCRPDWSSVRLLGYEGNYALCACERDLDAEGTPRPGTVRKILLIRKY